MDEVLDQVAGDEIRVKPVGRVVSPFPQKFTIPRQSLLVPQAKGAIQMLPPYADPAYLEGLDGFSHIWVFFGFHANPEKLGKSKVRPPRLGGNKKLGVFATRSSYRPNGMGLSLLQLESIDWQPTPRLHVAGLDLLDGTPIYDIKPYLPFIESIPDARAGFAPEKPAVVEVEFSLEAEQSLDKLTDAAEKRQLIVAVLSQDPRPAYKGEQDERTYGAQVANLEVRWRFAAGRVVVECVNAVD